MLSIRQLMCRKEFVWNFEVEKVLNNNINFCVFVFTSPCFDMIFVCLFLIHSFSSFCGSYNKDCWRDAWITVLFTSLLRYMANSQLTIYYTSKTELPCRCNCTDFFKKKQTLERCNHIAIIATLLQTSMHKWM